MSALIKLPIIIFTFFVLALIQNSFLSHVAVAGFTPNLIFILFFFLIFLDPPSHEASAGQRKPHNYYQGILVAILAGFITDLFMPFYFGPAISSFLLAYVFIKTILYFLKENKGGYSLVYFIPLFLVSLVFYNALIYGFLNFPHEQFSVNKNIFIELAYNLTLSLIIFYIYKLLTMDYKKDRQLKLFR